MPAVAWRPREARPGGARPSDPRPVVLLGHGGSGDKLTVAPLAERLVADIGAVVVAIDGPVHGDRRTDGADGDVVLADFRALWRRGEPRIGEMAADWRATLDEVGRWPDVDADRIGWCGVSMGTAYGVSFVAAEPRVRAAVLGMWGLTYPSSERLALDAPSITCPVLFQRKADDELFPVVGQEALFALLGTDDKELRTYPGRHATPVPAQVDDQVAFLARQLLGLR